MNRRRTNSILLAALALLGVAFPPSGRADDLGPELARATKAVSRKGSPRKPADPPPEFPPAVEAEEPIEWEPEIGEITDDTWDEQRGPQLEVPTAEQPFAGRRPARTASRRNVRPIRYQGAEDQRPEDTGNVPVPGAEEELGPAPNSTQRYQQHAIMYDDAAQAAARQRTVRSFHGGHPTNNNNEFGDFAYHEDPPDGPQLPRAGFYGYGPDHDRCFGCGRCGRDALCCPSHGDCRGNGCDGCCEHCGLAAADCCPGCGSCGPCESSCGGGFPWWENFTVSGGVQGFKSPIDLGRNGNFGLREGFNWGLPVYQPYGIGAQVGLNALQSSLSGNNLARSTNEARSQLFITAGLFRRALVGQHWQGGVAYDYLHDDYYITNDLHKIRGELSFVASNNDDIGAWVSIGLDDADSPGSYWNNNNTCWTSNDLYAFFWRRTLTSGTLARAWAGFSGSGDGMLGGELRVPVTKRLAVESNVNYLIPRHGSDPYGAGTEEAWNVAIGIAWYPGGNAVCSTFSPWRPLFGVADNAIFPYTRR